LLPLRFEVGRAITADYLDPIIDWLDAHPDEARRPIYTNSQLLAPYLEIRGRPPGSVYFLAGIDSIREEMLTNEANGQRATLRSFAENDLYGKTITHSVTPADIPAGALVVVRIESRTSRLLPDDVWAPHLEVLVDEGTYRIARMRD
jgi:hypothetical protein